MNADERFMGFALEQARHAMAEDEVPVGAVLVENQKVISSGYNRVEGIKDPTAHAEIEAIRKAARILDRCKEGRIVMVKGKSQRGIR